MNQEFSSHIIFVLVSLIALLLMVFLIVITLIIRYRKRKKENQEMQEKFNQVLLSSKLEIQEQTLQHISREIHDNLGQVASLIKINLITLDLTNPVQAAEKVENSRELIRQLITDLKILSGTLNGDKVLRNGLLKALEHECMRLNHSGAFMSTFTLDGQAFNITPEKAIILYRMCQELMNNAIKHSDAKNINIVVYCQMKNMRIEISDDGKGFEPEKILSDHLQSGNGLGNLSNRASLVGATITFDSTPGKGTTVNINIKQT